MINFSKLHLTEGESLDAAASASEKAVAGGEKQASDTSKSQMKQKAQMATQKTTMQKSGVSYASEEARKEREYARMIYNESSDWRQELNEALGPDDEGNHPFVDVMPSMDQKQKEAKRQMKAAIRGSEDDSHHAGEGGGPGDVQKESALNPFQVHFDKDGKSYKSKGSKQSRDRIAKNIASNRKRGPMAQDPYKPRRGESD